MHELWLLIIKIGWSDHEVYVLSSEYDGLESYAEDYLNKHFGEELDIADWRNYECEGDTPIAIDLFSIEPGLPVTVGG